VQVEEGFADILDCVFRYTPPYLHFQEKSSKCLLKAWVGRNIDSIIRGVDWFNRIFVTRRADQVIIARRGRLIIVDVKSALQIAQISRLKIMLTAEMASPGSDLI